MRVQFTVHCIVLPATGSRKLAQKGRAGGILLSQGGVQQPGCGMMCAGGGHYGHTDGPGQAER